MAVHQSANVHSSSVIEEGAVIGADCKIGPFCHIGPNVTLENGVQLHSHVVVAGHTVIGDETTIWPFASIGHQPQDLKFDGEQTRLVIGKRNMIRESVSINPGTSGGGALTQVGDDCLFMLGSHVGHDCMVGNNVILANNASLAGHVILEDNVIIGGLSGVHQFCRIGAGAIIGAVAMVTNDVIPYGAVLSDRAELAGLNLVGLKRRGIDKSQINGLRAAFNDLFLAETTLADRIGIVKKDYADNPLVLQVIDFLESKSNRSFLMPKSGN